MTPSGRTPVGGPSSDPRRDSELGLPHTYVRTHGDELVQTDDKGRVSNARDGEILISLNSDDLHFIVSYDPERERSANRRDLVAVIEEFQALINDGVIPNCHPLTEKEIA